MTFNNSILSRHPHSLPSIHPPPPHPPKSATVAKTRSPHEEPFVPYPDQTIPGYPTAHPHITVEPIGTAHIPSLTRITGILLPIRYPNSFYTATITDPVIASLSRVAIYHDHPVATSGTPTPSSGTDKVIGAIRCRLERRQTDSSDETNLYIQTLHLLSPYRGHGVAAALLNALLFQEPPSPKSSKYRVSKLVRHYRIRSVTAHVHQENEDALRWYTARGFKVEEGVVEGYYRRLNPSGARIVRLDLEWQEYDGQTEPCNENEGAEGGDEEEEEWEKIEAHDGEEAEETDHGVRSLPGSQSFEEDTATTPSRKRKAEDEKGNNPQRR